MVSVETKVIIMNDRNSSKMLSFAKLSRDLYESKIGKKAKEYGISKQEADVLLFFGNNKEFDRACDAVTYRGFSKAYVSKALSLLIKRGYVDVSNDSCDKRYQRIVINDSANLLLESLRSAQDDFFSCLSEGISEEEFMIHIKVIDKIAQNIVNKMKG